MGWKDWMWSSPTKPSADSSSSQNVSISQNSRSEPSPVPKAPPRQLSRDEQAEQEFQDLLKELDQPPATFSTLPPDSPQPRHKNLGKVTSDPDSLHPINLLPTEMSCRAAFDAAFYCQSMGGQFVNVYRYGGMRNCSEMWSNFWFCMRTNRGGLEEQERMYRIKKHYWEREEKYRTGPSSEDVWQLRTTKVTDAFNGDYEALEKALESQ